MSENQGTGRIAWRDLTVPDAARARDFYAAVCGWEWDAHGMGDYDDYSMRAPGGTEPVAGVCHARGTNAALPAQWLLYVTVPDVEAAADRCRALGGEVLDGPRAMGGGRFACIRDPDGACLALWQPAEE